MPSLRSIALLLASLGAVRAACPYMTGELEARDLPQDHPHVKRDGGYAPTDEFLSQFEINDTGTYMTSDVGGPIEDQNSLSAGDRGPTLLEDFIFRQKIQHFDHERVPERAVHARGAGAHGVFTSYGNWSNITGASFLAEEGKQTPVFMRFSTVAGSRGSADTARDVHGFAVRFYTDEGNFDIVGNNIPVFFIQDAILFPDLIHAVKPKPDREIPQAATAHDSAWDFFSQQPSSLHTLFWAMAQHGIVRSFRHMDGFGVHTFRLVTEAGTTKLVKFHFKSLQGKAGLVWEEAQVTAGKNIDFHRQDLFEAIENGYYPEWEFGVQIMEEEDQLRFGFDLFDPTKLVPEELVPITPLGKLTLNRNPRNYFSETEQVMFQPGHIVRGVDFTEDPLLQGRLFSYLDTQLNRHGGPNFEQLPINQPRVPWHNNNRDGAAQMYIPLNENHYTPNSFGTGPAQANRTQGRGFFTAPNRVGSGKLVRSVSSTFSDVWSQPRLFYNSLLPQEKQFLINAIRFETANVQSDVVKRNVLIQLNRVSHEIAVAVATALGMTAPNPDPTYYHDNTTASVSVFREGLRRLDGLKVGLLSSVSVSNTSTAASALSAALRPHGVSVTLVHERLGAGANTTYSAADASAFDAVLVDDGVASLFSSSSSSSTNATTTTMTLYPAGRPREILSQAYRWGKPVAALGTGGRAALVDVLGGVDGPGVFVGESATGNVTAVVQELVAGLKKFKYLERFATEVE